MAEPKAEDQIVEQDELLMQPGTYFNPQTEVLVVVDDSTSLDQEIFNMEAYEGADWVRIADDVPVDEDRRDSSAGEVPDPLPPGLHRLGLGDGARPGRRRARRGRRRPGPRPRRLSCAASTSTPSGSSSTRLHPPGSERRRGLARRAARRDRSSSTSIHARTRPAAGAGLLRARPIARTTTAAGWRA